MQEAVLATGMKYVMYLHPVSIVKLFLQEIYIIKFSSVPNVGRLYMLMVK